MNNNDQKPNLKDSNQMFIDLIQKETPFSIVRLGLGYESNLTYDYLVHNIISTKFYSADYNFKGSGIYSKSNDEKILILFAKYTANAVINSDLLASYYFNDPNHKIGMIQDFFTMNHKIPRSFSRTLEPFYQIQENIIPWTHYLKGKKVLIINPFVESFKKQLKNQFKLFKPPSNQVFLEDQEFIFYKSYQTLLDIKIHDNWFETYNIMCQDIKKLDFDIALLGCGAYGLPLCNFIKSDLKKSAIYIGGGLQLLFGVIGRRWEGIDMWKKMIIDNDIKFIRPSEDEHVKNMRFLEDQCYW